MRPGCCKSCKGPESERIDILQRSAEGFLPDNESGVTKVVFNLKLVLTRRVVFCQVEEVDGLKKAASGSEDLEGQNMASGKLSMQSGNSFHSGHIPEKLMGVACGCLFQQHVYSVANLELGYSCGGQNPSLNMH